MTTVVAPAAEPVPVTSDDGNEGMSHYTCCLDDRAICGTKVGGDTIPDEEPADCVVCRAMEDQPCEVTCHPWMREAS